MPPQVSQLDQTQLAELGDDSVAHFVRWAIAELHLEISRSAGGSYELTRREPPPSCERIVAFRWSTECPEDRDAIVHDPRLLAWLGGELRASGPVVHARPTNQPTAVHDLSARLFKAYHVDGGNMHLSGCRLEDQPFLRLSYAVRGGEHVEHYFFCSDGEPVEPRVVENLGLNSIVPAGPFPPRIDPQQLTLLVSAGRRQTDTLVAPAIDNGEASETSIEPLATTILWAKYVTGKLQFTIGEATANLAFGGWARTLEPPAFQCNVSQTVTFHVGATDDGRIVAAEEIATCSKSGKRVVENELVKCSVTGKSVRAEFTLLCTVSGQPTLREEFAPCERCHQEVSRIVLEDGVCTACRQITPVSADDPRIVWLLGEYPGLDRFRRWQLSETAAVYIVQAATLWKRLLLVVDKESIEVLRAARRGALASQWTDLEPAEQDDLLR